jgi:putative membrane protein insertion efficiency factor
MKRILTTVIKIPRYIASWMIRGYQFFLSTDHAFWAKPKVFRICTYHPSCSEYTRQAILKHGFWLGGFMGVKRIVDCNPFSHGGHDPVPDAFTLKRYKGKDAKPAW